MKLWDHYDGGYFCGNCNARCTCGRCEDECRCHDTDPTGYEIKHPCVFQKLQTEREVRWRDNGDGTHSPLYDVRCMGARGAARCGAVIPIKEADRHAKIVHDNYVYEIHTKSGSFDQGGATPRDFGPPEPSRSMLDFYVTAAPEAAA